MGEFQEQLAEIGREMHASHDFCRYCGRELIEVEDWASNLCDPATGRRPRAIWKQCPRFARQWRNLWMGGCHDSFQRDNPIRSREYQ